MGGIAIVYRTGAEQPSQEQLRRMTGRSSHLGQFRSAQHGCCAIAILSRDGDAAIHEGDDLIIAIHGYPHRSESPTAPGTPLTPERLGREFRSNGVRCFEDCRGEYAIAILDKNTHTLWLTVSLSMTRPLFHATSGSTCAIGTEIRQVFEGLALLPKLRPEGLVDTLFFNGPTQCFERTSFADVERLLPPRIYQVTPAIPIPTPCASYWTPPDVDHGIDVDQATETGERLLKAAAARACSRDRTAVSVSGGLDSTLIWALLNADDGGARTNAAQLKAYSLAYPGLDCDESCLIEAVMDHVGTRTTLIDGRDHKESAHLGWQLAAIDDVLAMPTAHQLDLICETMVHDGLHTHVTGVGAERAFQVTPMLCADQLRDLRIAQAWRTCNDWKAYGIPSRPPGLKRFLGKCVAPSGGALREITLKKRPPRFLSAAWHEYWSENDKAPALLWRQHGYHRGTLLYHNHQYALGSGLEKIQQQSEAHGVELRAPYLDQSIIDFSFRVPPEILAHQNWQKGLQRRIGQRHLPPMVNWQNRKMDFSSVVNGDWELLSTLPPVQEWKLCELGILDNQALATEIATARAAGVLPLPLARFATAEHFTEKYLYLDGAS